tara:strand:- start:3180 stop:3491 length:312 start_codon:yes stop_codon:yes gene_type:complete
MFFIGTMIAIICLTTATLFFSVYFWCKVFYRALTSPDEENFSNFITCKNQGFNTDYCTATPYTYGNRATCKSMFGALGMNSQGVNPRCITPAFSSILPSPPSW